MPKLFVRSCIAVAFFVLSNSAAQAQSTSPRDSAWVASALLRQMSLVGRNISLRDALDRWSARSNIRLTYSSELLPLDRSMELDYHNESAVSVLRGLVKGISVSLHQVGGQMVIGPATADHAAESESPEIVRSIGTLDRVVVTGSVTGTSQRGMPIALNVVNGNDLVHRGNGKLSDALDGSVPGVWLWQQSPLSMLAKYGSIRGASSFGLSYPKVYIDGIEAANSLLVTHLDPDAIARVEVIRGPQGAALYGADAISGVINIVTRQEGNEAGAPRLLLRTSAGGTASDYSTQNVVEQQHAFSFRVGNGTRSGRSGLTYGSLGAFIPDAFARTVSANAGGRIVKSNAIYTGTARFFGQNARTPPNPLLADITTNNSGSGARPFLSDSSDAQRVREYTLGGTALFTTQSPWTHTATAGIDGYTLKTAAVLNGAFPSAIDSALRASQGNAVRGTFHASSILELGDGAHQSGTITLGVEHSAVREQTSSAGLFAPNRPPPRGGPPPAETVTRSNTGLIGQFSGSLGQHYYVTAGMRAERNSDFTGAQNLSFLPMLGASVVSELNGATIKFRSAYGKGIRPPQTTARSGALMGLQSAFLFPLSNEEQAGIELGADAFLRKNISAHITRFDQRASGLIQPVSYAPAGSNNNGPRRRIAYQLQNVGEISNKGWELEGHFGTGPVMLVSSYTNTDSRVEKLAAHYSGDLKPGDRMLEVPRHTFGVDVSLSSGRVNSSITYSRASDWINYDRIALAAAYANTSHDLKEFVGPQLRTYWRSYSVSSRLGGNVNLSVRPGLNFVLSADNVLNEQVGQPDNVTLVPGRSATAGFKLQF